MLNYILEHWAVIITGIFAILGLFKINLTLQQKKAITLLWNEIDDVIISFMEEKERAGKKPKLPKAQDVINIMREKPEVKGLLDKIDKTKGHNSFDVVYTLLNNYNMIKTVGNGAWKLAKGFLKVF